MEQRGVTRRGVLAASAVGVGWALAQRAWGQEGKLEVSSENWGEMPGGGTVELFTLSNGTIEAKVMTMGATLTTVKVPDREGKQGIVTLYLDSLEHYLKGHPLFGSTVGRFANRIGGAKFTIDGKEYNVTKNSGQHHIHGGGAEAFHRVNWKGEAVKGEDWVGVRLTHVSRDGEAGYPGTVNVSTTYKLTKDNRLIQEYEATTDRPTHVNLTNHVYWNLLGAGEGDVLSHVLTIHADQYLPTDPAKIPTGEMKSVKGTVMDFTTPQVVGSRIKQVEGENYDHCYVVRREKLGELVPAAVVREPKTGRVMEVWTTKPGVQLYTARGVSNRLSGGGKAYGPYHGLCLETQHFPDAPNKPMFPNSLVRPGEKYQHATEYRFSVQGA